MHHKFSVFTQHKQIQYLSILGFVEGNLLKRLTIFPIKTSQMGIPVQPR